MKLLEALEILKRPLSEEGQAFTVLLACGFTPLHLKTFLSAELALRMPARRVAIEAGLFGDLAGTLERHAAAPSDAIVAVIEWTDLDPRLGVRTLGGWRHEQIADIVESSLRQMERIAAALKGASTHVPAAVSLPTLPLPPLFPTPGRQASAAELRIRQGIASLAADIAGSPHIRMLHAQRLDETSAPGARLDIRSEIATGFPYQTGHASALAAQLAELVHDPAPRKGLITDLDDTFWAGILGEAGVDGVAWDLSRSAQLHGIYQQFLASLASAGVLLAVASKNNRPLVEEAFRRKDILCGAEAFFPMEVHWQPKSESIGRILEAWNIGPEAVVFVDDSPMETAEVAAAHPGVECLTFPRDAEGLRRMIERLRDLFGKTSVREEDALRLQSLRSAQQIGEAKSGGATPDSFLAGAEAAIEFTASTSPDERAFELINKTNQFNLNGRRWDKAAWNRYLAQPGAVLLTAAYADKYGPLGKIAALLGRLNGPAFEVDAWVMSCRAFSRRIEHQALRFLFDKSGAREIRFDFDATPRNGPLCEFLSGMLGHAPEGRVTVPRETFESNCPALFHQVNEVIHV
jgi:FkbH-like protein